MGGTFVYTTVLDNNKNRDKYCEEVNGESVWHVLELQIVSKKRGRHVHRQTDRHAEAEGTERRQIDTNVETKLRERM